MRLGLFGFRFGGRRPASPASVLFAVVVFAVVFGMKAMNGAKPGEACTRASDCARLFNAACVLPVEGASGYCSRSCGSQGDCVFPDTCSDARAQQKKTTMVRSVCVRPAPER